LLSGGNKILPHIVSDKLLLVAAMVVKSAIFAEGVAGRGLWGEKVFANAI